MRVPVGLVGSPEFLRVYLGFFRFFKVLKDITGTYGLLGISLDPRGFGGFHWILLGFLGFLRVFEV